MEDWEEDQEDDLTYLDSSVSSRKLRKQTCKDFKKIVKIQAKKLSRKTKKAKSKKS